MQRFRIVGYVSGCVADDFKASCDAKLHKSVALELGKIQTADFTLDLIDRLEHLRQAFR